MEDMRNHIHINKVWESICWLSACCLLTVVFLASCDDIDEGDRLIPLQVSEVKRCVLIEDFTGQRCVNCPNATLEIEKLQEQYGADTVIAVAIHSGPFAHRTTMSSPLLPLGTELGDQYFQHWGIEAQPGVKINRGAPIYDPTKYAAAVNAELNKQTPLEFTLQATLQGKQLDVFVTSQSIEDMSFKLQIWLTENNIVSPQLMPDGSSNSQYVHNHVFRASLTDDPFGIGINLTDNGTYPKLTRASITLDDSWNPENLNVVAFAYTDAEGVLQAVTAKVRPDETE